MHTPTHNYHTLITPLALLLFFRFVCYILRCAFVFTLQLYTASPLLTFAIPNHPIRSELMWPYGPTYNFYTNGDPFDWMSLFQPEDRKLLSFIILFPTYELCSFYSTNFNTTHTHTDTHTFDMNIRLNIASCYNMYTVCFLLKIFSLFARFSV